MSVEITALVRPKDLDSTSSLTLSSVYFMFDSVGWTLPKQMTIAAFLTEVFGANYARPLSIDAALSGTLQAIKAAGTSTTLRLSTTTVEIAGNGQVTGGLTVNGTAAVATLEAGSILDSGGNIQIDSNGIGFFGTATQAKPTVTGSRGGNAALASLLTALAAFGLITNSTSA